MDTFSKVTVILDVCEQVNDLTPLKGMPLTSLNLYHCVGLRDFSPLAGMKLTRLSVQNCGQVRDLAWMRGMPLTELDIRGIGATDLTPLQGMPLDVVYLNPKGITNGMQTLRQMKGLRIIGIGNDRYQAAEFWKRYEAGEFK